MIYSNTGHGGKIFVAWSGYCRCQEWASEDLVKTQV